MGELGRQLARVNRAGLLKALTQAYADEWFAHYNYQFTANALWGHHSPSTTALLSRKSVEAFVRTNRLAQRLLQLGGQPVAKLTDLVEHATDKPFKLPKSMADVHGVLTAVLDAERTSVRTYQRLYRPDPRQGSGDRITGAAVSRRGGRRGARARAVNRRSSSGHEGHITRRRASAALRGSGRRPLFLIDAVSELIDIRFMTCSVVCRSIHVTQCGSD